MLLQYKLVALLSFLLVLLRLSHAGSRCYSRYYCSYSWSGWTSSGTGSSYRRSYCSESSIYCREGRDVSARRCPDKDYQDIVGDVETPIKRSDRVLFAERLTRNGNSAIQFSSDDARYMTARMISTLDSTVSELPRGFSLVVVEGYQDKDKGNASFPLQYEGTHLTAVEILGTGGYTIYRILSAYFVTDLLEYYEVSYQGVLGTLEVVVCHRSHFHEGI